MSSGFGASDIFLAVQTKRGGRVKGEATAPGHEEQIAVASWRWSVQASSSLGSTAATVRRSYSGLTVVKAIDSASSSLLSALATNDEVKEAVLTMRKAGDGMQDYLLLTLREARVTQVEHSTSENGSTSECVTFAFRKVEFEYRHQEQSGVRGKSHVFSDEIMPSV